MELKKVLDFDLDKVGGKFLFQCNFESRKLPISLPVYYKECLDAWTSMHNYESVSHEGIMNQIIWNNKHILSEGKSFFSTFFFYNHGIIKMGDLVSKDRTFFKSGKILNSLLSPSYLFALMASCNNTTDHMCLYCQKSQVFYARVS